MIEHMFKLVLASGAYFPLLQSPFHVWVRQSQQLVSALTLTISAHSHLSLFVGVLQSLMSHPLHALRHSPGSSSTSFKGLLSGCKSQCKWFPCNNFQFSYSFYGQGTTWNKLGKLGKIEVISYIHSKYLSALLKVVGHNCYVMLTILNILQLSKESIFSLCNNTLLESK